MTDPAAFTGSVAAHRRLFRRVYLELENRIRIFASLPLTSLDSLSLQKKLDDIGRTTVDAEDDTATPVSPANFRGGDLTRQRPS